MSREDGSEKDLRAEPEGDGQNEEARALAEIERLAAEIDARFCNAAEWSAANAAIKTLRGGGDQLAGVAQLIRDYRSEEDDDQRGILLGQINNAVRAAEPFADFSGDDWRTKPPEREWIIENWLAAGRAGLLTGRGGRGKSRLGLQLGTAVAAGLAHSFLAPRPGENCKHGGMGAIYCGAAPVVFASWEDDNDEIHRRLHAMGDVMPWMKPTQSGSQNIGDRFRFVDMARLGPLWAPSESRGGSRHISTMASLTLAGERLMRHCERLGAKLLVIDPLAAAYASDENSRALVRNYMTTFDGWARETGCAVLMIAHPPKSGGDKSNSDVESLFSGSTDWFGAARSVWALHDRVIPVEDTIRGAPKEKAAKEKTAKAPCLDCLKASYGPKPDPVWVRPHPQQPLVWLECRMDQAIASAGGAAPHGASSSAQTSDDDDDGCP